MIQLRLRITWPLAILILISLAAWLLRHASQTQARPATRPIHRATIIDMPVDDSSANGQHDQAGDPLEQILRDGEEAAREAARRPNEFTFARQQREERRNARRKTATA